VEAVVYANGESTVDVERRWLFPKEQWPIQGEIYDNLKDLNHSSWSMRDAADSCDLIHVNTVPAMMFSRFLRQPVVYTMHHPHIDGLSNVFSYFPDVHYVTISDFQRHQEKMPRMATIQHGINFTTYHVVEQKRDYLAFIGRIAPVKGPHIAIEVAKKAGMPLKIAGEVQPIFREYFEREIKPHVDGKNVEFVGELGMEGKNEFLGAARALLFPIEWEEPFGLVMIEAMACGTPVLAFGGGSVPEIVREGVSGAICGSVDEMAQRAREVAIPPATVRAYAEENFSVERMVREYHELYERLIAESSGGATADDTTLGQAVA
jgi:glycosyltransferase involved in cell wall biosynthesis